MTRRRPRRDYAYKGMTDRSLHIFWLCVCGVWGGVLGLVVWVVLKGGE